MEGFFCFFIVLALVILKLREAVRLKLREPVRGGYTCGELLFLAKSGEACQDIFTNFVKFVFTEVKH